jgi:putative GTP pyrophosphokinase
MSQDTLEKFLVRNRISMKQWQGSKLKWNELISIGEHYEKEIPHLEGTAAFLANIIQKFNAVHSVRWRVKDKDHLLAKIVRKRSENNEKYKNISKDNYGEIITDLIGIRALHLFKDDFSIIDKSVVNSFSLKDKTRVYIRQGDDAQFSQLCLTMGFEVEEHPKGYRSIHYVISTQPLRQPIYVELQVRTIFEEGWSEIDHLMRYPNYSDDAHLAYLLTIFNRMAGSADEMGRFVRNLADVLNEAKVRFDSVVRERNDSIAKVEALVNQLAGEKSGATGDERLSALKTELKNLKVPPSPTKYTVSRDLLNKLFLFGLPRDMALSASMNGIVDPGLIRAAMAGSLNPSGVQAAMEESLNPSGVQAAMEESLNPSGVQAAMEESLNPSGVQTAIEESLNPSGVQAAIEESLNPSGVQAAMKNILNPSGDQDTMKGTNS